MAKIVIIGGGPAGIAAAVCGSESGASVTLLEGLPWLGGPIWRPQCVPTARANAAAHRQREAWLARLRKSSTAVQLETQVIGCIDAHTLLVQSPTGVTTLQADAIIVASGARELFLPFPGWTLPGVSGAGGLQLMAKSGLQVAGKRIVVAGTGPLLWPAADFLVRSGANVLALVEQAPFARLLRFALHSARSAPGKLWQALGYRTGLRGTPLWTDSWIVRADGDQQVRSVTIRRGVGNSRKDVALAVDLVACGFGLVPNLEVAVALGCETRDGVVVTNEQFRTSVAHVFAVGELTGISGVEYAIAQGCVAGCAAAGASNVSPALATELVRRKRFASGLPQAMALRPEVLALAEPDTTICRCENVSLAAIQSAIGLQQSIAGEAQPPDGRALRLATRCGMGRCQGRICGPTLERLVGSNSNRPTLPLQPTTIGKLLALRQAPTQPSVAISPSQSDS